MKIPEMPKHLRGIKKRIPVDGSLSFTTDGTPEGTKLFAPDGGLIKNVVAIHVDLNSRGIGTIMATFEIIPKLPVYTFKGPVTYLTAKPGGKIPPIGLGKV